MLCVFDAFRFVIVSSHQKFITMYSFTRSQVSYIAFVDRSRLINAD